MTWVSRNAPTYSVPCSSWSSTATTVADDSDGDGVAGDDDVVPDVKRVLTGFLKRAIVRCGGGVARYAPRAQDHRRREPMSDDDDFVDEEREREKKRKKRAKRRAKAGAAAMKSRKPARGCSEESEDAIAARETEWLPVRVARLRERSERAQRYQFEPVHWLPFAPSRRHAERIFGEDSKVRLARQGC